MKIKGKCSCGEDLVTCENCGLDGCPECSEGWSNEWYMDEDGIYLCPECLAEAQKEYREKTKNGTEVCGTCSLYTTDENDEGYCEFHQEWRREKDYCEDRLPKTDSYVRHAHKAVEIAEKDAEERAAAAFCKTICGKLCADRNTEECPSVIGFLKHFHS